MKINTKKNTIKLSPTCMINDANKTIDIDAKPFDKMGRTVKYVPTMIFTPVMSSDRTKRTSPEHPRLTKDDIDEVSTMLSNLFIKKETEDDSTTSSNEDDVETDDDNSLGRFKDTTVSSKSKKEVSVLRSARLARRDSN